MLYYGAASILLCRGKILKYTNMISKELSEAVRGDIMLVYFNILTRLPNTLIHILLEFVIAFFVVVKY